ncbi:MAG: 50S ribosomal protein L11 methyltransferase [Rikenellaceae bacterium]
MDYVELNIAIANEEQGEILIAELAEFPFESFQYEAKLHLKGYIPQDKLADCKGEVDELLASYGISDARYISIETQNWNAEWESNFERVEVGNRLLIRAPFHDADPSFEREVIIMPKMSFGTGHHATTHLMAEWTMDLGAAGVIDGKEGLDMGSGTGVLAIVAAKEGAKWVDAVDIDEWADENCRENIAVNGVAERVHPMLGDFSRVEGRTYDFILANINRNILVANMPRFAAALHMGGVLLISGFLEQDIETLRSAATNNGLTPIAERVRDGWVVMKIEKIG